MEKKEGTETKGSQGEDKKRPEDRATTIRAIATRLDDKARAKGWAATVNLLLLAATLGVGTWMIVDTANVVAETTKAELITNTAQARLNRDFNSAMSLKQRSSRVDDNGNQQTEEFGFDVDPKDGPSASKPVHDDGVAQSHLFFPWASMQITLGRLLALMLVVFLVTLLAGIYRYNTRLQEFYTSRARMVELLLVDRELSSSDLLPLLLVETVEVDKMPRANVAEWIASTTNNFRRSRGKPPSGSHPEPNEKSAG